MTAVLVAGLFAGYGIALPVGAVATYLVTLTARTSLRVGTCAALGVATADGIYALLAVLGGAALTPVIQPVAGPLRWASALVLTILAVRVGAAAIRRYRSREPAGRDSATSMTARRAYVALLGITLLNPTTVVYFTALVLGSQVTVDAGPADEALFALSAFTASASWQLILAGGGALLGRLLTGARGRLVTALASSTLIIALAVHLLVSA